MTDTEHVEILLVEDLESDADLCIRSLKKHNLINDIKWVVDGEEALEYLFGLGRYQGRDITKTPKIILLDLKMPKLNGIDVLRELRKNDATAKIPVVVMTSSKETIDIQRAYDAGANSYIVKPVQFDNFAKVVRDVGYYWLMLNERM